VKQRIVTHEEAEAAFTRELAGESFTIGGVNDGRIVAIRLPEMPEAGGSEGRGFLPLTYVYEVDGEIRTLASYEGPEIAETRSFLRATLPDYEIDQRLELWFEDSWNPQDCGCGCGC
jgi:hypothetical protein